MKAPVGAFNQEKALVGAFSVIVQPVVEPMEHYTALVSAQSPAQFRCSSALLAAAAAFIDPTSGREPGPSQSQQPGTTRLQQPDMQHTQQGGHRYYVDVCNLWDSCHWIFANQTNHCS